jgi:hypothetical protein
MYETNSNQAAGAIERLTRDGGTLFASLLGEEPTKRSKRRGHGRAQLDQRTAQTTRAAQVLHDGSADSAAADDLAIQLAREYHASGQLPRRSVESGGEHSGQAASTLWRALVNLLAASRSNESAHEGDRMRQARQDQIA